MHDSNLSTLQSIQTDATITDPPLPLMQDPFVCKVIDHRVRMLMAMPEFAPHEREDVRQELFARLDLAMRQQHDPAVGHRHPFIVAVVARQAASVLEPRQQQRRDEPTLASLSDAVGGSGQPSNLGHCITNGDNGKRIGTVKRSDEDLFDLREDVQRTLEMLTPEQRELVELLPTCSLLEVSRRLGVSRSRLRTMVKNIATIFEERGLRDYLS